MFNGVRQRQITLTFVGETQQRERVARANVRNLLIHVGLVVDPLTKAVAHRRRAKEGQHDIRTRRHTPKSHGLTKIFFLFVYLEFRSPIDDAAHTQGGVDGHPHGIARCGVQLQLGQAVEDGHHVALVAEKIADAFSNHAGQGLTINDRNRTQHQIVCDIIEGGHLAVEGLKGV